MPSKKNLLRKSNLCVILDRQACPKRSLIKLASAIKNKGAGLIQYRDKESPLGEVYKNALALRKALKNSPALFIVNDYVDIAKASDSDGVHLGQEDLPIKSARLILGRDKIIGKSCHNLAQAQEAQKEGADYIGIGPVFATPTKPGRKGIGLRIMRRLKAQIKIPFFAIGGIDETNAIKLKSYGAGRIAVVRAVCKSKSPAAATERFANLL